MKTDYLQNTTQMLRKAYQEGYAIGAFNVNHVEQIQAIVGIAGALRSAVILQASALTAAYTDLGYLVSAADHAAKLAGIPVALHLDHGASPEVVRQFVEAGFSSVMIDGSRLPFEENVAMTAEVCAYAHAHGVSVEGELGTISGIEDETACAAGRYTDPDQAREFVLRTGVDSLAVAIGTSHGAYKFRPGQKPMLRLDILAEIERAIPGVPIVLHGASAVSQQDLETINRFGGTIREAVGIPEEILAEASAMGVCKVNMDTDLRLAMTAAIRKNLAEQPDVIDTRVYLGAGRDAVSACVRHKLCDVLHSAGRYPV